MARATKKYRIAVIRIDRKTREEVADYHDNLDLIVVNHRGDLLLRKANSAGMYDQCAAVTYCTGSWLHAIREEVE